MKDRWEVFEGRQYGRTKSRAVRVTLGHGSTFYLNAVAYEALGRPAAVEFMYDGNRREIGIRRTDPRRQNAFSVRAHASGNYMRISAAAFIKFIKLKRRETMLFEQADVNNGVLVLPVDSWVPVGRGAR